MKLYSEEVLGAKYVVNYHDGEKKHDDGSDFYDMAIFKNKVKKNAFVKALLADGYRLRPYDTYPRTEMTTTLLNVTVIKGVNVAEFVQGYITCMLWSSNDESNDQGGDPLDKNYDVHNLAPEAREEIEVECRAFLYRVGHLITEENFLGTRRESTLAEFAGHDFWLTRVGHGAGFWDGDWSEYAGEVLTACSKHFGEVNPYVQDGQVGID